MKQLHLYILLLMSGLLSIKSERILSVDINIGNIDSGIRFLGINFDRLSDNRYEGWAVGGGTTYGYSWIIGSHWSLESAVGLGYAHSKYNINSYVEIAGKNSILIGTSTIGFLLKLLLIFYTGFKLTTNVIMK